MKRTFRTALLSVVSAGIALGGFYTGYAKSAPLPSQATEIRPTYFDKLPPNFNYSIVIKNASELGFSQAEIEKLRKECAGELAGYLAVQRKDYDLRLERTMLAEEGKIMAWGGLPGASTMATLRQVEKEEKPLTQAWAKFSFKVASTIGKQRNAEVIKKTNQKYWGNSTANADLLLDPIVIDKLGLTQAQKNQLILVTASNASVVSDPAAKHRDALEFDQASQKIGEYQQTLRKAKAGYKLFFFAQASGLFSPMQKFRLDTMIRNQEYVQP